MTTEPATETVRPATQNQIRAEQLIESLFNDPEMGPKLHERAQKMFGDIREHPAQVVKATIVDPAIKAVREDNEALKEQLSKALERLDARDKREEEEKTFAQMQAAVDTAVSKYGLTEEGRQKMLDRMKETKNYTDPEGAAAAIAHDTPPPASSGPSWAPRKTDFYGTANPDEAFAKLHKDPEGAFLDDEIGKFLKNPAQYAAEAA
jgi:hypothetical protein